MTKSKAKSLAKQTHRKKHEPNMDIFAIFQLREKNRFSVYWSHSFRWYMVGVEVVALVDVRSSLWPRIHSRCHLTFSTQSPTLPSLQFCGMKFAIVSYPFFLDECTIHLFFCYKFHHNEHGTHFPFVFGFTLPGFFSFSHNEIFKVDKC